MPNLLLSPAKESAMSRFACSECGRRFLTVRTVLHAVHNGCPRCRGFDINLDAPLVQPSKVRAEDPPGIGNNETVYRSPGYFGEETDPMRPEIGGEG